MAGVGQQRMTVLAGREPAVAFSRRTGSPWSAMAVLLLAFALRVFLVDVQSLRGDEALSVIYAQKPLVEIIEITRFVSGHPPLFYSTLHFWQAQTGTSEFAVRLYAVWWSVLSVSLILALGSALFGREAATWAAFLVAFNPFHIMHAQDLRAYTMLVALAALSCLALWNALYGGRAQRGGRGVWLRATWTSWFLYAVSGLAVVYCHYFGAFVVLAQGMFFLWARWRGRASWRAGILAFGAIGALLLPWLWLARDVVTGSHGPGGRSLGLAGMLQQSVLTFGIGYWRESWGTGAISAALVALLVWGVWRAIRRSPAGAGLMGLVAVVPLFAVFCLSLSRPIYRERYLSGSAPAYAMFWGVGLAALASERLPGGRASRWALAGSVVFLVGFNGFALAQYYVDPAYAKSPEWRGAISFLTERFVSGDAVILNHQDQAVLYYLDSPDLYVLPSADDPGQDATRQSLQALVSRHDRVWLIPDTEHLWDRDGVVRSWLDQHGEQVVDRSWRGVLLVLYHTPQRFMRDMTVTDARLGESIRLHGYALRDGEGNAVDRVALDPGQAVDLTLYWQAASAVDEDYTVFVHLLDPTGWLRGQQDNQPRNGTFPTRAWAQGELVVDRYHVLISGDAPAGEYLLEVGMYHSGDGTRLSVGGMDTDPGGQRVLVWDRVTVR
jgi:4-amino-4-deoxy-L-arabinose transferase-like glycosyltransferase